MALGTVQTGYRNSLCMYSVYFREESDISYADLLAELTTELELAFGDGDEEPVSENDWEDSEQTEALLDRKKEWEELLEQSVVLEVMLRQMLENGLGQRNKEQEANPKKQEAEELDNDFELSGIPEVYEGRQKDSRKQVTDYHGDSEFLQNNAGSGSEYFSPSAAGRQSVQYRTMCLTCQTECDRKKQWKITE